MATRDEITISKFAQALEAVEGTPSTADVVALLTGVLQNTRSAPAGGNGAVAQRIVDFVEGNPNSTAKAVSQALQCSIGRVYEVAKATPSPLVSTAGVNGGATTYTKR